jgi:hypothetical protein
LLPRFSGFLFPIFPFENGNWKLPSIVPSLCWLHPSILLVMHLNSTNLDHAKFWLKVQYIGIPFITTFWLILVMIYTGHQTLLKRWVIQLLFVIPFLTLIFHYTNDIHHLFYRDILFEPSSSNLSAILLFKGPWYWVHISYLYLEAAFGMGLFVRMYSKAMPIVRKQVVMLILGAAAPLVG